MGGLSRFRKARFYISVSVIYALTLLFAMGSLNIGVFRKAPVYAQTTPVTPISITRAIVVTAGKPVRIVVPRLGVDLPVDDGTYDIANKTWTLSGYHAQFALPSVVANDYQGNTLIY